MITVERLRELLHYDPATGAFTRLVKTSIRIQVGDQAGTIAKIGYRYISIAKQRYLAHRLAWLYMTGAWPESNVDHHNLNKADNSWKNLRLAGQSKNQANRHRQVNNTSGFKGVHWHSPTKKWRARIMVSGKNLHLGLFDTPEAAHAAYAAAADKHFGEFARAA